MNKLSDKHTVRDAPGVPCWLLNLFPLLGLLTGMLMWLVDAWVDVTFIHTDEPFLTSVFAEDGTELWMRSLIVVVMTVSAIFAQRLLRKQNQVELLLRKHQHNLEELVEARTLELEKIANLDPLTQIYNRRKFSEKLNKELQRARRYEHALTLIMFDLDYFKAINDQYGHAQGDNVLQSVAQCLKDNLRNVDLYARWGGEEFIVLLPHIPPNEANLVAEKLRLAISKLVFDQDIKVTASFGISCLQETDEDSLPLIKRADDALYQAKRDGRNRVCSYC
jgi:diguanylate cyclase (GGDEF)-like protein